MTRYIAAGLLVVLILGSAMQLVMLRHESKELVRELRTLKRQEDSLERTWSQLLLEQGTQNAHSRVERLAREKLGMTVPPANEIVRSAL